MTLMRRFIHVVIKLSLISSVSFAHNSAAISHTDRFSLGLDLGPSWTSNLGNSTQFPLGYSTFSYTAKHNAETAMLYGISLGKSISLNALHTLQIGLTYHYIPNLDANGYLQQGISTPYYQANYSYSVYSSQLLAEAKIVRQWRDRFYPYISIGLGGASNTAKSFKTSVPNYLTLTPYYANKTHRSFSYSLGLGVDYLTSAQTSVGLGYRFSDLGMAGLGDGLIRFTQLSAKLKQSNLYLNTLLIQLNYFI